MTFNFSKHRLRAKDKPPPPGKPIQVIVKCDACHTEYLTTIMPGVNELYKPCDCGGLIHVCVNYDGAGNATLIKGTIETAYKDGEP